MKKLSEMEQAMIELFLEGHRSPEDIARYLTPSDLPVPATFVEEVASLMQTPLFVKERIKQAVDKVASGLERFKRNIHRNISRIEDLAEQDADLKTKLSAVKYALEQGGLHTVQRHEVFTPRMYEEQLEPLLKKEYRAIEASGSESGDDGSPD